MKSRRYAFCSNSESETAAAGRKLAGIANGVICLIGELGTGKTVFTKGIAEGLGIDEYITSPTFNIVNVYEKDGYIFNHMDAYRITNPEMLHDIGFEEIIEEATSYLGSKRLLFGTDMSFSSSIGKMLGANISYKDKVEILNNKKFERYLVKRGKR